MLDKVTKWLSLGGVTFTYKAAMDRDMWKNMIGNVNNWGI